MSSDDRNGDVLEITQAINAAPEVVYKHIARVEGLAFMGDVPGAIEGGRSLVLIAPDPRGDTTLTVLTDAGSSDHSTVEARVRAELSRVGRLMDEQPRISPDADGVGLDAIREELEHGPRGQAPFAT
jgi:hypothetical protein